MIKIFFTQHGFDNLKKELDQLDHSRIDAVKELKSYREMGDLSENSAYRAARLKLNRIDGRIRHLNRLLDTSVIKKPAGNNIIEIGSKVTIDDGANEKTFTIVGSYESDINGGKLSYLSPLGKALMGRKIKEIVIVQTPSGMMRYTINNINI